MRAIQYTRYGAPDVLSISEVPTPAPGEHEVLVEVAASAVTHGDRRLRAADFPGIAWLPGRLMTGLFGPRHRVPGTTFAGRVAAIGAKVSRFAVGDDVFGIGTHGAYAEKLVVAEHGAIARSPSGLDAAEVATLPYGALTALTFLKDLARVQPGERVVVVGASGEVGRFAVQIARQLGAEVTGVCSRDHALVIELGAHHVVDHTREDFTAGAARYDVVFDTAPGNRFARSRRVLTPGGRHASLNMSVGTLVDVMTSSLRGGPRAITGVSVGSAALLDDVRALAEAGALRPTVARRFALEEAAEAHALLEAGTAGGSVVVCPGIVRGRAMRKTPGGSPALSTAAVATH